MYELTYSNQFKREYRLMKKRGYDMKLLQDVVKMLKTGKPLDEKYHDHPLDGDFIGSRECHIRPDWLLIYWKGQDYIELQRTGTHSDLF
ncbi:MAG TPA: type II toxin-antitoxin system YafQ family toxin [Bacillota bacterium]|nr:type II toxin-antitoxin system YafQ family toxin [Bacillota bacterium]